MRRLSVPCCVALAACGPSNPLEGKTLVAAPQIDDLVFDATTDAMDRLVTIGMNGRHTYRLDPRTLSWEDLGVQAERPYGPLFRDSLGNVYVYDAPETGDPELSYRMYRLDGTTWTRLVETTRAPVARPDGSLWQTRYDTAMNRTLVDRFNGTTWDQVGDLAGLLRIVPDNRGTFFLVDVDDQVESIYRLSPAGDAMDIVLDCPTNAALHCKGRADETFYTDEGGTLSYVVNDELNGNSGVYRVRAGSTPTLVDTFPEVLDMFDRPIDAPHAIGYDFDRDGNFYLARGSNVTVEGDLFFLGAGESSFEHVIDWGHGEFTVYIPIIGIAGTVFAFNTEGPIGVLR